MILLTVASDPSRAAAFIRSADHRGFIPAVLGTGRPWKNLSDKIRLLAAALPKLNGTVMYSDSYDAMVVGTPEEAITGYRSYDHPVVFSAERNCWPPHLLDRVPLADTPYRFLNSGGFIGEAKELAALYAALDPDQHADDQAVVVPHHLDNPGKIVLDTECRVFQCLYQAGHDVEYPHPPARPYNTHTDTTPVIIHGNGKASMAGVGWWDAADRNDVAALAGEYKRLAATSTLHVVTPCSRHGNLSKISPHLDGLRAAFDCHWWVALDPKLPAALPRPQGTHAFRAKKGGAWGAHGRNQCLDMIDDGWVVFLDDDTVPHPDLASAILTGTTQYPEAFGFVFSQEDKNGNRRLTAEPGQSVDTGTFVFRREAIGNVRWALNKYTHDQEFFAAVTKVHPGRVVWIDRVASIYNKLRAG